MSLYGENTCRKWPSALFSLQEVIAFLRFRVLWPSASWSSLLMMWRTFQPTTSFSRERDELGQELRIRSQFAWTEFTQSLCNLYTVWRPLKQSFYMSRVRRKEGSKTYSRIPRKSDLNSEILKPWQIGGVEQLSSFNEFALFAWFLEQTWKLQHLILKCGFLKYLNTS